ncbi:hypothetical protein EBT31_14535 [bacterium]|nr:hypothetical protein [bacterium]
MMPIHAPSTAPPKRTTRQNRWRAGFDATGRIAGLEAMLAADGGHSLDLTHATLDAFWDRFFQSTATSSPYGARLGQRTGSLFSFGGLSKDGFHTGNRIQHASGSAAHDSGGIGA